MPIRTIACARLILGALAMITFAPGASAQMPPDVAEKIREIGRVIDVPKTYALLAPLHTAKEPYPGVRIVRDVKYGPDERNRLDVFTPEPSGGPRAVLMWVHGGGFVRGDKRGPNTYWYDNVMLWAARNGMVAVNLTYRLAPAHKWPAGAEDMGLAVRWVLQNIATLGGDPTRVFLAGHSAGASHVAEFIAHPQLHPGPAGTGLKGAIVISVAVDSTKFPMGDSNKAYYSADETKWPEQHALPGLLKSSLPLLVAYAELEPPAFEQQSKLLNDALCKLNRCPRLVMVPQHSHQSQTFSINTMESALTEAIVEFVKNTK